MKKCVIFVIALALSLGFAITAGVAGDTGPEEMVLKTADSKKPKPALFPHAKHQQMEGNTCATCHHSKGDGGMQVAYVEGQKIEKCQTCHNADLANAKLNSFKKAAHKRCQSCHKEKKAAGVTTAPTKCTGCHPKDLK
jgi:hypothetical protein